VEQEHRCRRRQALAQPRGNGGRVGAVAHVTLEHAVAAEVRGGGNSGRLEQAGEVRQGLVELCRQVVVMMRDVADDRRRSGNI
jgi:hypothetical protein